MTSQTRLTPGIRWGGLIATLILLLLFIPAKSALAQPPVAGEQPPFEAASYSSADGKTTVHSQETTLSVAYFEANGQLDNLTVSPAGLTLTDGANQGSYESDIIRTPLASTTDIVPLWRADLPPGSQLRLETRLNRPEDGWSEWVETPEAFYPVRNDEHGGTLIWVGGAQVDLQFRLTLQRAPTGATPSLTSLSLVFNDTSSGPTDGAIAVQMQPDVTLESHGNICPLVKPPVVSRTQWGCPDGQSSPRRPPVYAPVTHIILHHSATPNQPYQSWASVVRSIWNYHANVLWWGDVGYNYMIDPNGVIYEGRAGGDEVIGIHDTHNVGSMAIGFLGCYGNCNYLGLYNAEPSQAMLDAAVELMAWKFAQTGIDPLGRLPYDNLYDVPVIAGGRDVTATYSPGDNLYYQLPFLRDAVAGLVAQCDGGGDGPYGEALLEVQPRRLIAPACSFSENSAVVVNDAVDLKSVFLKVRYDPQVIQVMDAGPHQSGVQVQVGGAFASRSHQVLLNTVDTYNGLITFQAETIGQETIDGLGGLITIDWRPQAPGLSPIILEEIELVRQDGRPISYDAFDGEVEITAESCSRTYHGAIALQGRSDYSGITILENEVVAYQTGVDGRFTVAGEGPLTVHYPGYLTAEIAAIEQATAATADEAETPVEMGSITLLAGDINGDDSIDIFDLTYLAGKFQSTDAQSDFNGDGQVTIQDLALVAGNYQQQGPLNDWR